MSRKNDSTQIPFHYLLAATMSAGVYGLPVQPGSNFSPRLLIEADAWAHFRVKRLSFRLHPLNAVTNVQVVGYIGGVQDSPPNSVVQISELLPSTVLGGRSTKPTEWVHVPRVDLAGPFPWYKSITGAADATEESPGTIYVGGTGTDGFQLELRGVFEFKTSVATANTPVSVQLRQRVRAERIAASMAAEKALLLKILGTTQVNTP